jgi:hypothetical protein
MRINQMKKSKRPGKKEDFEWLLRAIAEKVDNFIELNHVYDD